MPEHSLNGSDRRRKIKSNIEHLWQEILNRSLPSTFHIASDSRFNEYIPSRPLIGLGFFSCLE